jgi:uncharacterized protein YcfJ
MSTADILDALDSHASPVERLMSFAPRLRILPLAALALGLAGGAHAAAEYGTVVSSTPVYAQVPASDRVCTDDVVTTAPRTTGAGAVAGAIFGGVIGNQFGHGAGRAAATGLGVVLGSAIGNQAEANGTPPQTSTVQRCQNVSRYEDRVVGYDVVYEYAGMQRTARMAQDPGGPGSRIAVDVNITGAGAPARASRGTPVPPVGAQPAYSGEPVGVPAYQAPPPARVVYATPPVPAYYYPAPVYVAPAPVYYGYPSATVWIGGRWHRH